MVWVILVAVASRQQQPSKKILNVDTHALLPYDYRQPLQLGVLDAADQPQPRVVQADQR